jgi:c(7)-type cytochrome triheme protein
MTRTTLRRARLAAVAVAVLLAAPAAAGGKLQKLPTDYVFARGEGSPGPVTFSHESHVDAAKPSCVTCHAKTFRILEAGRTFNRDPIRHDRMEAGAACGACHGKTAFGFESCDLCHK